MAADGRGKRRRDDRRQFQSITLPGEALQKYGQQPALAERQAVSGAEQPEPRQSRTTSRPSTLVEQPIVWDGVSLALPGETLSRRRERPAAATAEHTESSATESAPAEQATAPDLQAVSSENAAIDTVFPPADAEEPAPLVLEEEELDEESASVTQMPEDMKRRSSIRKMPQRPIALIPLRPVSFVFRHCLAVSPSRQRRSRRAPRLRPPSQKPNTWSTLPHRLR